MRRRWWFAIALFALLALGVVLVIAAGPRLACRWVRAQVPLMTGDGSLVVTGAAVAAGPPAEVVVQVAPERLHQIIAAAVSRWIPGCLFSSGQSFWGVMPPAEGAWWRVNTAPSAPLTVFARLTRSEITALATNLAGSEATQITVTRLTLDTLPPGADGAHRYAIDAAGSLGVHWGRGTLAGEILISIRQLKAVISLRPSGRQLAATVHIDVLETDMNLLGSGLKATGERALNKLLAKSLREVEVPTWIPWEAHITVRAGTAAVVEL